MTAQHPTRHQLAAFARELQAAQAAAVTPTPSLLAELAARRDAHLEALKK